MRKEGVFAVYKGATPPLMGWMVMDSVYVRISMLEDIVLTICRMLGSLTLYRRLLLEHVFSNRQIRAAIPWARKETPDRLPWFGHGIAGIMAGSTVSFIAAPVEHVKARLQIQYAADKKQRLYSGPIDCSRKIVSLLSSHFRFNTDHLAPCSRNLWPLSRPWGNPPLPHLFLLLVGNL